MREDNMSIKVKIIDYQDDFEDILEVYMKSDVPDRNDYIRIKREGLNLEYKVVEKEFVLDSSDISKESEGDMDFHLSNFNIKDEKEDILEVVLYVKEME